MSPVEHRGRGAPDASAALMTRLRSSDHDAKKRWPIQKAADNTK
jgi:hypothetical protein